MQIGLTGFASLGWPALMKLRAEAPAAVQKSNTAVILVWLRGGCSHLDTYDPKPDAPSEYRSPFEAISTNVPGTQLTEILPLHAKIADKFTLLRGMAHTAPDHLPGSHQMLSGDPTKALKTTPKYPDWMSIAHHLRSKSGDQRALPNYVGVNPIHWYGGAGGGLEIAGPVYLGTAHAPFRVTGDPNRPEFAVPNIGADETMTGRLQDRVALRKNLDGLERSMDSMGTMDALDEFEARAMALLTNPRARDAFDLGKEDTETRERYGRHRWSQQLLMARRLVESGVEIVTSVLDGPQCGRRVRDWDDHGPAEPIFEGLKYRAPDFDQAVSALIEDIYARGLDKRVLVVVSGEFGRTPKISEVPGIGSGKKHPGRNHWSRAFTNLWAGGGIETGGVIGATDQRGEDVTERICGPGDFLATIYRHLGIDAAKIMIEDHSGRPTPILPTGKPIPELVA